MSDPALTRGELAYECSCGADGPRDRRGHTYIMMWSRGRAWRSAWLDAREVPNEVRELVRRGTEARTSARRAAELEADIVRAGADQPGFRGRLYPYQVDGVALLASRPRALLADDMGLAKTAQTIAVMARLLVLLCRAAARTDPGDDPAALLAAVYGDLVPEGTLTTADAHALSRAAELARAFAASPVPAPMLGRVDRGVASRKGAMM